MWGNRRIPELSKEKGENSVPKFRKRPLLEPETKSVSQFFLSAYVRGGVERAQEDIQQSSFRFLAQATEEYFPLPESLSPFPQRRLSNTSQIHQKRELRRGGEGRRKKRKIWREGIAKYFTGKEGSVSVLKLKW